MIEPYLILPLAGWVIQVGVAPVVADPLLGLLVHPVELVGAALHVVTQGQQVLLPGGGVGLEGVRGGGESGPTTHSAQAVLMSAFLLNVNSMVNCIGPLGRGISKWCQLNSVNV